LKLTKYGIKKLQACSFYAVEVRYPLGRYNLSDVRDTEAITYAEEFQSWIEEELRKE